MKTYHSFSLICLIALFMCCTVSCSPKEQVGDGENALAEIENPQIGIRLVGLAADFAIAENEGACLVLVCNDPTRPGQISFLATNEEAGVNLVAATTAHREEITAKKEGIYKGGRELIGPFGPAFYSRGEFKDGDETKEETRLFTLNPGAKGLLTLIYSYPAGNDSTLRVNELMEVFSSLEAATAP